MTAPFAAAPFTAPVAIRISVIDEQTGEYIIAENHVLRTVGDYIFFLRSVGETYFSAEQRITFENWSARCITSILGGEKEWQEIRVLPRWDSEAALRIAFFNPAQ